MKVTVLNESSIDIGGTTLTTAQVDQLLHDIAVARNLLKPEVPREMRDAGMLVVQSDPDIQVGLGQGGQDVVMGLRHRGLGWFVFSLDPKRAGQLRDFFAKRTRGVKPITDIDDAVIGPDGTH